METGDQQKKIGELEVERYKANETTVLELLRATVQFEHAALKPLPLLNGGAIVAALTFAGHALTSGDQRVNLLLTRWALTFWAAGLICAVAASFCGYFSQRAFLKAARRNREADEGERSGDQKREQEKRTEHDLWDKFGEAHRRSAYILASLSLGGFVIGSAFAILSLDVGAQSKAAPAIMPMANLAGLALNVVGSTLLIFFTSQPLEVTESGAPLVAWTAEPSSLEARTANIRKYRSHKRGFTTGVVCLLIGFLVQFAVAAYAMAG